MDYRLYLFKKKCIILLILPFLLLSCDQGCIEADDFGEMSDYDVLSVFANSSNCSYDTSKPMEGTDGSGNNNETITTCLQDTIISSIPSMKKDNSFDTTNIDKIKSVSDGNNNYNNSEEISSNAKCSIFDPLTDSYKFTYSDKTVGSGQRRTVFNECLKYCQNICANNAAENNKTAWDKANLKDVSEGSLSVLGITLKTTEEDVRVKIKATGSITLSSTDDNNVVGEFKSISRRDTNYSSYIAKNSSIKLDLSLPDNQIELNKYNNTDNIIKIDNVNSKFANILDRVYLEFMPVDTNLFLDQGVLGSCSRYKNKSMYFQNNPLYYSVWCRYSKNSDDDYFTQYYCDIDYRNVFNGCIFNDETYFASFVSRLNSAYPIDKINSNVFDDNFYIYAINGIDYLTYDNDKGQLLLQENTPLLVEQKQISNNLYEIKTQIASGSYVTEGYFWIMDENKDNSFNIDIDKPIKIAIKQITNGNACEFRIEEKEKYADNATNLPYSSEENKTLYFKYAYDDKSKGTSNKWQVLKNSTDNSGNEIIFNPYSVADERNKITLTFIPKDDKCVSKLLIKIIYLKDYQVNDSGFLFFNIPESNANSIESMTLSYTLLNKNILSIGLNNEIGIDNNKKYNNFFEFSEGGRFSDNFNNSVGLITANDVNNKLDTNNYSDIFDTKSIMVRKGQVIRFNYNNWFNIDGEEKTTFKDNWIYTDDKNKGVKVPFGMGLMGFLKQNPLLICIGNGQKLADMSVICENLGGVVENIKIAEKTQDQSSNTTIQSNNTLSTVTSKCYIPAIDDCLVTLDGDYNTLASFNYNDKGSSDNCYYLANESSDISKTTLYIEDKKIMNFAKTLYQMYYYIVSNELYDKKKSCDNFIKVVNETYNKVKNCIEYLANTSSYKVYVATLEKNTAIDNSRVDYNIDNYVEDNMSEKKTLDNNYKPKSFKDDYKVETISLKNNVSGTVEINYKDNDMQNDEIAKKMEFIRDMLNIQVKEITIENNKLKPIYDSFFKYYKEDFCKLNDEEKQCIIDSMPYCYDISEYKAKISTLLYNLNKNKEDNSNELEQHGKLVPMDRIGNFGASFITSFAGSKGTMKNFIYNNEKNDRGEVVFNPPSTSIMFNYHTYLTSYFINDFTSNTGDNVYKQMKNSFKYYTLSKPYLYSNIQSVKKYRNGERLSIFIANDKYDFYGDKANSNTAEAEKVYLIAYTDKEENTGNTFKFNSEGSLINKYTLEPDFLMSNSIFNAIKDVPEKEQNTLFFKIIDTDESISNNSGSYSVTIRTSQTGGENFLVKLIRKKLFENIMTILDGNRIYFQTDAKGDMITCDSEVRAECYKYDIDNPTDEKVECVEGDSNCYRNCVNVDRTTITAEKKSCKLFHDGNGFVKNVFIRLITNPLFNVAVKISFILMLSFYGLYFFLGKADFTYKTLMNKILRVCFIYFMISRNGWEFFDKYIVSMFKVGVDSLLFTVASAFESSLDSDIVRALEMGDFSDKIALFSSGIKNVDMLFNRQLMAKLTGLAFSSILGPIYMYLLLVPILTYVASVFTAMFIYLTTQIYMSFVLSMFPLVLIFLMFDSTQKSLSNWFNMMLSFVFQEIFLVLTMSFFNSLMLTLIKNVFSYRVCWTEIFNLKIAGLTLFQFRFWRVPDIAMFSTIGILNPPGMPNFYNIMFFYMVASLTSKFIPEMTNVGGGLVGGVNATGSELVKKTSGALTGGVNAIAGAAKSIGKNYYGRKINDYADRFGLDPEGKKKEARDKKRKDWIDKSNTLKENAMKDARQQTMEYAKSDQFMKDLKEENPDYDKMSDKEKKEARQKQLQKKQDEYYYNNLVDAVEKDDDFIQKCGYKKEEYEGEGKDKEARKRAISEQITQGMLKVEKPREEAKPNPEPAVRQENNNRNNNPNLDENIYIDKK